jgi:BirA family biotin operon repressor/biotin-[acetyl-CoA-carboxylase] ligase
MHNDSPTPKWEHFEPNLILGAHVLCYDEIDSTMDIAWMWADHGAPHGVAVRASAQRAGRGRFSRRWVSGPDESLLLSLVLRNPPVAVDAPIAVAATLAIADTVTAITSVECGIKWPNDVQVGGKKIAGVLVETRVSNPRDSTSVLGIGLNVNLDPRSNPQLQDLATSIANITGKPSKLNMVQSSLLKSLDSAFNEMQVNPSSLMDRWRSSLSTIGQEITIHERNRTLTGVAIDVDHNGYLLLRTRDNLVHVLAEGDVTLRG